MYGLVIRILIILLDLQIVASTYEEQSNTPTYLTSTQPPEKENISKSDRTLCKDIDPSSVSCEFNKTCIYAELNTVNCHVDEGVSCRGERTFSITFHCFYCWQLPENSYSCTLNSTCKINTKYLTTCNVNSTTYCLGQREFSRYKQCNIVTGHKWSMAVVLSVLFGGFGIDRFYLGHWQEGVGKLFSFGGFGIWTLIDTILISIGYLKPADLSQYE